MAGVKLSRAAVIEKSREILAKGQYGADFSYITDEMIASDAALGSNAELKASNSSTVWYGNNARYGVRTIDGQNYQVYYFDHGGNAYDSTFACGSSTTGWVRMDMWHHTYLGTCTNNGREMWSFSQ